MKQYILFDHDGVLVETEHWYYMANKKALEAVDIELPMDAYLDNMSRGISSWQLAREAGIDEKIIAKQRKARDAYYQEYLACENIEIPGVIETLAELSADYRMAIVTTSKRPDFDLIHRDRRIKDYMDFILTVEDYRNAKPHPEPYLTALKRFDANADQAAVVEDSARGLKSAVAAGIDCIIVHNNFTASHDFSGATIKINAIIELPKAIEQLSKSVRGAHPTSVNSAF